MITSNYEIPLYGGDAGALHGWLLEAAQEGAAWLQAQKPARNWQAAVAMMEDGDSPVEASNMSNTTYPKAKRTAKELVASLASFRHEGEFKVQWDNSLYDQAHLLTDLDYNWYLTTKPGNAHRKVLQGAVIKGTGYWWQEWDKNYWGPGKGDTRLQYVDPENVTFVQLPTDHDIQRAYMTIIKVELPINLAKRIFAPINSAFAAALVPDRESPSWVQKGLQAVQKYIAPALRVAGRGSRQKDSSYPTVDIYYGYTADGSVNQGFDPVTLGALGSNWSYTVPYVGMEKPTGMPNAATGQEFTIPAKWEDCQLFPLKRLSIWSGTGIAYDGTSPWWHGDTPLSRVRFNDLPWQALGGSVITDIRTMEGGITALMRAMEDSAAARLDPAAVYDDNIVSKSWAEAFNPRMAGVRASAPLSQGSPITYPVPPEHYNVPSWIPQFMEAQENRMDYITAVRDLVAMAKAKQIPGADTLEKLMEMAGPIMHDMVGALEDPLIDLGNWRKSDYFQFYNSARVIRTVGPDDVDPENFQYDPERLDQYLKTERAEAMQRRIGKDQTVANFKTGGYQFSGGMLLPGVPMNMLSTEGINLALRRKMSEFRYEVTESGINEIHRMTTKLFYLQLMKEGFPISWWTFAKIAKIPNFGPPPKGTNTELERWMAQQWIKIDLQADLQKEMMTEMGGGQMGEGALGGGGNGNGDGSIPPIGNLFGNERGRPQGYKKPPRMVQKDHNTRSTITTS